MAILGLDLAKKTGFAVCRAGQIIAFGSWPVGMARTDGRHNGHMFMSLYRQIEDCNRQNNVNVIAWERAHHRGGAATRIALGLVAVCQYWAAIHDIKIGDVHTATLKKWATGCGRAGKDDMIRKASVIAECSIHDADEADAICVARYVWEHH